MKTMLYSAQVDIAHTPRTPAGVNFSHQASRQMSCLIPKLFVLKSAIECELCWRENIYVVHANKALYSLADSMLHALANS